MTGNIDTFKKKKNSKGVDQKTSQYLVWPPFASCSTIHLLWIQLIRLLIVACGMLSQSSSMAVLSCWIFVRIGTCCSTCLSRASQTCSMGDMSREYSVHGGLGHFQHPGIVSRSLWHGTVYYRAETWGDGGGWLAWQWFSGFRQSISVHSNCHRI